MLDDMFEEVIGDIRQKIDEWGERLSNVPTDVIRTRRNSQNRNIKQIVGHMIDSAVNNHHRIVRLQYTNPLTFPDYWQDNDRWIAIQNYEEKDWDELVAFWQLYNLHMIHLIKNVDLECVDHTWQNVQGATETLKTIIEGYAWHLNLHLDEIDDLLKQTETAVQ